MKLTDFHRAGKCSLHCTCDCPGAEEVELQSQGNCGAAFFVGQVVGWWPAQNQHQAEVLRALENYPGGAE